VTGAKILAEIEAIKEKYDKEVNTNTQLDD
jgi:hypothetical protein